MAGTESDVRVVASGEGRGGRSIPAAAILIGVLALVVGLLIGRATAPDKGGSAPKSTGPGPTREVSGVPIGYAHTREGAVAALLNYGVVLGDPRVLLDPGRRAQVLRIVATARYATTFEGRGAAGLEAARRGPIGRGLTAGATTLYLASPIAYRVTNYTGDAATVEGWGVSVVGNDRGVSPRATWGTTTTTARWQNGDWKVDVVNTKDGPAPALAPGQAASNASEFIRRTSALRGLRHAP